MFMNMVIAHVERDQYQFTHAASMNSCIVTATRTSMNSMANA